MSTWTAEGAKEPWPKFLLPQDIPEARISAFGYDAEVMKMFKNLSQNTIGHHAHNLLADLANMRLRQDTVNQEVSIYLRHADHDIADRAPNYIRFPQPWWPSL